MGRAGYKPVIEICGGTEIGGGFVAGSLLQAQALSAFSTPGMGCSLFILGNDGFPLVRTDQLFILECELINVNGVELERICIGSND